MTHHPRMTRITSLLATGQTSDALRAMGDLVEAISGSRQPELAWHLLGGLAIDCRLEVLEQLLASELPGRPAPVQRASVEIRRAA